MKVGLITTWQERCGIAEYGENLVRSMPQVTFDILNRDRWNSDAVRMSDCEIIHVNYEPGLMNWITLMELNQWKSQCNKRIVFTWHTSAERGNRNPMHPLIDRVVMHEVTDDGYVHIPHGIEEHPKYTDTLNRDVIGTAGFPFPWKGFPEVAAAAKLLGMKVLVIAPASRHYDTEAIRACVMQANPDAQYRTDWLTTQEVIRELQACAVNVFAYHGAQFGISGAARMGISAQRPLVLTRNRQFRDLYPYEDEIAFAASPDPALLADAIQVVLESGRIPTRVMEDMAWSKVGQMYYELYKGLGA